MPLVDLLGNPLQLGAVRRDSDATVATADGAVAPLHSNSFGRLKVSAMPAAYTPTVGTTTAVQANPNTAVAAATVFLNVSRSSNVSMYVTGTFAGLNVVFEASLDSTTGTDGNWFGVDAKRTNGNVIEATSGVLGAAPTYAWEASVNAYTWFRVRAIAFASGAPTWQIIQGAFATEPTPAIGTHAVTGSGSFNINGSIGLTGGYPLALTTVAGTNITVFRAAGASLYEITVVNTSAAKIYLKFYNSSNAPVLASDIPLFTYPIAAGTATDAVEFSRQYGPLGKRFTSGISIAITGAQANTDTTAVAAGIQFSGTHV